MPLGRRGLDLANAMPAAQSSLRLRVCLMGVARVRLDTHGDVTRSP